VFSEVEGITLASIEDVDLADGTTERVLRVQQRKGRKDRIVPLNTKAGPRFDREIATYARTVRPMATRSQALFLVPSERGADRHAYRPLSTAGIRRCSLDSGWRRGFPFTPMCAGTRWRRAGSPPACRHPS